MTMIEEMKAVYSQTIGDLLQQIALQRTVNRQQDSDIELLRKRIEELQAISPTE